MQKTLAELEDAYGRRKELWTALEVDLERCGNYPFSLSLSSLVARILALFDCAAACWLLTLRCGTASFSRLSRF